ncbi:MAG: thioredoxin family protein [Chloroflexi bacterium]|nr:thioredoxin family protein [Chloroflexota bacterium]
MFQFDITRLIIALGLCLLFYIFYLLIKQWSLNKVYKASNRFIRNDTNENVIIYFSTPDCVVCKTAQRPALDRLKNLLKNNLAVVEINAYENPKLTSQWGILSVPSTVVLDKRGEPKTINYGIASFQKLLSQIEKFEEM